MATASDPGERSPFANPRWIAALLVVVIVVVLGIWLSLGRLGASPAPAPTRAAITPTQPEITPSPRDSICGLPASSDTTPLGAPPRDAEWSLIGATAVPQSRTAGPGVVEDNDYRACFSRSPEGAVMAAVNWTSMAAKPSLSYEIVQKSVVPGPGRDLALRSGPAAMEGSTGSRSRYQVRGFRVLGYTSDSATVDVAIENSANAYASLVWELTWHDGDWKFALSPSGQMLYEPTQIPDLSGYVPWSGV